MGVLASSFGIFLSKVLGLFYYSPLSAIAGEENMAFYSIAYTYYDLLLQVSSAGIPFAIAVLVSKYAAKKDYKTVLLVKKLGMSIVLVLSVLIACVFILISTPLAKQSLGSLAPNKDIENLKTIFYILTIAIIFVPFLSSLRGYIQGLKRLDIYGASQVLEQFVRVFSIIIFAFVFVKLFKLNNIWAIYVAIAAASFAAIVTVFFTKYFASKDEKHVLELANQQEFDIGKTKKEIISEIISIGVPFLIISFLGTMGPLVNTTFFMDYMTRINGAGIYESAKLSAGILQANIAKISNIPSVLALGFGSGMVPYLSESLEQQNNGKITKYINQILDAVSIILVPIIIIFVFFAKDIYFIMYGNSNLELGANLFAVSNIQILLGTFAPVFSSIMMSLKLRKESILTLIISFLIKIVTFFPLVKWFGAYGMIYSSGFYYISQIVMYFYFLRINFDINIISSSKTFITIIICSIIMVIPAFIIHNIIHFTYSNRLFDILIMFCLGIIMLFVYYFVTNKKGLITKIFDIKDVSLLNVLKKLRS